MKRTKPLRARGKRYRARIKRGLRLNAEGMFELRKRVFDRSRGYCEMQNCNRCIAWETFELDHIIRRGAGGEDSETNCRAVCRRCHRARHGEPQFSPLWRSINVAS